MRGIVVILFFCQILSACGEKVAMPKPRGLYRIEIPETHSVEFTSEELPYKFELSQLVTVELPPLDTRSDWINLSYESLNAKIYCSYQKIQKDEFPVLEQECRELVLRSIKRADAVREQMYENSKTDVYGVLFLIEGETPSPIQFMLTDSTSHFFRGALYYQCAMDVDSLAPVTAYLYRDIAKLIQTFRWK